tara:strand:+ start:18172 stop:18933 length:762 start_codon:yes stop_codon:yes gene_type:complete
MTNESRVSAGIPAGGQFASNNRPEAQIDLTGDTGFSSTVTDAFESAAEAFEKVVDTRISDMILAHYADGSDRRIPVSVELEYDDESACMDIISVTGADGEEMFDMDDDEDLREAASIVASYYPNAGFTRNIDLEKPNPAVELADADAAVEVALNRRQEAVVRGLAETIHERFEYATDVLLSPDEMPVVEAICDSEGASLWDFTQERVDLNDDEADEYQQELAAWSTRLDLGRLNLQPDAGSGLTILPIAGATE